MNRRKPSLASRAPAASVACLLAAASAGCSSFDGWFEEKPGELEMVGLGARPVLLGRELVTGAYVRKESEDSYWFSDVPFEAILAHEKGEALKEALFVHAQLLWTPKPGLTPLDSTATNLALRVVVVSDGEVGIYGGAGFARPDGDPAIGPMTLEIEGATLTLLEKTAGFHDLLSPAGFDASLRATLAPEDANRWRRGVSQFATNAFKKSMWVDATRPISPAAARTPRGS
jgi:hypothetical protein